MNGRKMSGAKRRLAAKNETSKSGSNPPLARFLFLRFSFEDFRQMPVVIAQSERKSGGPTPKTQK